MAERKVDVAIIRAGAAKVASCWQARAHTERPARTRVGPRDASYARTDCNPGRLRMRVRAARLAWTVPVAAVALVVALAAPFRARVALAEGQFDDPFAYCAAVGTIDAPDARYAGPALPQAVARGLQAALGPPAGTEPEPTWRCMAGKVHACTFGANLPCAEKADTGREPSAAVSEFCRESSRWR
jgi:hypothetical protein